MFNLLAIKLRALIAITFEELCFRGLAVFQIAPENACKYELTAELMVQCGKKIGYNTAKF